MKYDPNHHHRRSLRLKQYDYSQVGAYFITICAQDKVCLFGEIVNGEMQLNDAGRMVQTVWNEMPNFYLGVETNAFIVMPNHIHGIIFLVGQPQGVAPTAPAGPGQPQGVAPTAPAGPGQPQGVAPTAPAGPGQPQGVAPIANGLSLPNVVHRFKTMTTKRYADGVKLCGWLPFRGRLWQRNYYEHVIRNDASLLRIQQYIMNNPARWTLDRENPLATTLNPPP